MTPAMLQARFAGIARVCSIAEGGSVPVSPRWVDFALEGKLRWRLRDATRVLVAGAPLHVTAFLCAGAEDEMVHAQSNARILRVPRAAVRALLLERPELAAELLDTLGRRLPPTPVSTTQLHERSGRTPEEAAVLEERGSGRLFRLSEEGRWLWSALDGVRDRRALTALHQRHFGVFAPHRVETILRRLEAAGFLLVPPLAPDFDAAESRPSPLRSVLELSRSSWRWGGAASFFDGLYRALGRHLLNPAIVVLALVCGVLGLVAAGALAAAAPGLQASLEALPPVILLGLIPLSLVDLVLHELAHGLALAHFGGRVRAAGAMWYWFAPVAFVDTSEAWLLSRRARLWITAAGPLVNFALGGVAVLLALASEGGWALLWWQFALSNYLAVLVNLNPLMKLDGYYLLIDLLERPQLRAEALSWLRRPRWRRQQRAEALYGMAALAFLLVAIPLTVAVYRLFVSGYLAAFVGPNLAPVLGWGFTVAVLLLATGGFWLELSEAPAPLETAR